MFMPKPKCFCEEYGLTRNSTLYIQMPLDYVSGFADGVAFIETQARFCPSCGRELDDDEQQGNEVQSVDDD